MSDSDNELLTTNNVFTFQNESTIVSARGPNINTSNLTGLSFRNNVLTSTMNVPRNYEWQRRPESNYDQRSMGYRRETSPMSIASACDVRQRNYHNSFYARGMSSQRSVYNGRAGSPTMSMRSIDSNATVSAADIVLALKNSTQFSKFDRKMIQEACNKFMKHKARRRVEKRRNLRLFLKGYRRKSGNDSGEMGSNSSISSDDNRSTRTLNYKNRSSCRSTKTDITDFRRNLKESNMFTDCTSNFKQNRILGMANRPANLNMTQSSVSSLRSIEKQIPPKSMAPPANFTQHSQNSINQSTMTITQKDRFKNGFLLPSQRFNRSVAATSIPEITEKPPDINPLLSKTGKVQNICANNHQELTSDDDNEEIFSELTSKENPQTNHRKRNIDSDDITFPINKRPKVASPCKNMTKSSVIDKIQTDFEFAKPAFPVRKSANPKTKEKILSTSTNMNPTEKLISKSVTIPPTENNTQPTTDMVDETEKEDITDTNLSQNNTDVSTRPSFIKRKLFSQKMDVTEKTTDIAINSPQNSLYGKIQKEKNKARKLVTSQYCLSRDIQNDENNLLDLIHKIVPAECMNATNQSNRNITRNKSEDKDNWDVTSIISTRNNDEDLSDTFTDEDTLIAGNGKIASPKTVKKVRKSPLKPQSKQSINPKETELDCIEQAKKPHTKVSKNVLAVKNGSPPKAVQKYVKSFWDTDFESDAELTPASRKVTELKENKKAGGLTSSVAVDAVKPRFQGFSSMFSGNKTVINSSTILNGTVDNTQKFNNTNKSFKICSHRVSKPKILTSNKVNESVIEPITSNQKSTKSKVPADVSDPCIVTNEPVDKNQGNSKPVKQKAERKKPSPKKQDKQKANKDNKRKANNTEISSKEVKNKPNTKSGKLVEESKKPRYNKKTQIAPSSKTARKDLPYLVDTKNLEKNKKEHTAEPPKNIRKGTPTANKKINEVKSPENKNSKTKKLNKTIDKNNKTSMAKTTVQNLRKTKLSESLIYEDSFTETNNNSIRPIRSCRLSKQNSSLNTSKANQTLNVTLRSKLAKTKYKKTVKNTDEQENLSDLSFSLSRKKPASSINTRLKKAVEIDTSDVSFTLNNDKGSPRKNKRKPAYSEKQLHVVISALSHNSLHMKELLSQQPRPVRNRMVNKKYVL